MRSFPDAWKIEESDFFKLPNLEEKIKFVLRYAILAPSTHNTQPWQFFVSGKKCLVFRDPKLALSMADPEGRDLHISLGCFLENLSVAARYFGIFEKINYFSGESPENLVAEVSFRAAARPETDASLLPLFHGILKRFNARGRFLEKDIPQNILNELQKLNDDEAVEAKLITDPAVIRKLAFLTRAGLRLAHSRPSFRREMSRWMHHNFTGEKDGLPGYSLTLPTFLSLIVPTLIRYLNLGAFLGKKSEESVLSAPLLVSLGASQDDPISWMRVGRVAERLILRLNSENIRTSVYVAALEMGNRDSVRQIAGAAHRPQFLFCAGFLNIPEWRTPRHGVSEKILQNYHG